MLVGLRLEINGRAGADDTQAIDDGTKHDRTRRHTATVVGNQDDLARLVSLHGGIRHQHRRRCSA